MKLLNIVLLLFCVVSLFSATIDFSKIETEFGSFKITLNPTPDPGAAGGNGKALAFDSLQVINVDENGRIIGQFLTAGFEKFESDVKKDSILVWTTSNISYTYVMGHRVKQARPDKGKYWSAVVYVRTECLCNDENEIYYKVPAKTLRWQESEHYRSESSKCSSASCNSFNLSPFILPDIEVIYTDKSKKDYTVVDHKKYIKQEDSQKKELYGVNDWIANHGIYRMYDTSRFTAANKRAYGDESMHMIYYPPIQHIGSYLT